MGELLIVAAHGLEHGDAIQIGLNNLEVAQVIGSHKTMDDEVMLVLVLPVDTQFTTTRRGDRV